MDQLSIFAIFYFIFVIILSFSSETVLLKQNNTEIYNYSLRRYLNHKH